MPHNFYVSGIINYSWLTSIKNAALLHQKYVQENQSSEQIACEFRCSTPTVKRHLSEAAVQLIPQPYLRIPIKGARDKKIIDLNEQRVVQMILDYRRFGMSAPKIADMMNKLGIPPKFKAKAWHYRIVNRIVKQHGMGRVKLKG